MAHFFCSPADWIYMYAFWQKAQEIPIEKSGEAVAADDFAGGNLAWNEAIKAFCAKYLHNLFPDFIVPAFVVSYLFFFGIGGFFHVSER